VIELRCKRFHQGEVDWYHADFDGDEMNMGASQSEEAKQELEHLMGIERHLLADQDNSCPLCLVQDAILGRNGCIKFESCCW
jgi:DNA-directed RNA polymerase beta' subunit